jgi:histidinol dehydrogenase
MPVVGLSPDDFRGLGHAAVQMANAEGLTGHSGAIQLRLDHLEAQND